MLKKIVWQRDVISHESCGEGCDVDGEAECSGRIVAQCAVTELINGTFRGFILPSDKINVSVADSHTLEKCVDELAEWLGGQGWWVGPKPCDVKGTPLTVSQLADLMEEHLSQGSPLSKHLWAELKERGWDMEQTLRGVLK